MSTQYTIGTGRYYCGAPYSELKALLQDGYKVLKACGFAGQDLECGARIYAKVFRQYFEQSGSYHSDKRFEAELMGRVLSELYQSRWQRASATRPKHKVRDESSSGRTNSLRTDG